MARPNMKSVRLSDEALAIVESAPGEGFNDKFERLIFDYSNSIPSRKLILENIDKRIKIQADHLRDLQDKTLTMSKIVTSAEQIKNMMDNLKNQVARVSQ